MKRDWYYSAYLLMCAIMIVIFFYVIFVELANAAPQISTNNGAWTYDVLYNKTGSIIGFQAGLYVNEIDKYNKDAFAGKKLTQIFSYGGSIEMYCKGSGGSSPGTLCNANNVFVYYDQGKLSTTAYYNAAAANDDNPYQVVPTIDGVIGSDILLNFNTMSATDANVVADITAKTMCADDRIPGVQFDLEPFDMNKQGQFYFFRRIAKNFAGQNRPGKPDPFGCVSAKYPDGRFFSVFSSASHANQRVGFIFNKYGNGYFIDSLYDLAGTPAGINTSLSQFSADVNNEVTKMFNNAKSFNIKYQLAIPASASAHEAEVIDNVSTGVKQIDYNRIAMEIINTDKIRDDPLFVGMNLWGYKYGTFVHGHSFLPNIPDEATILYLQQNL